MNFFKNFSKKLKLKRLFAYQDILKEELLWSESAFEEQEIREELEDVDYQIKSFKLEVTDEKAI